jgi:hypothetical protein
LNRPLVHENRFDLTQKINENFKDILGDVPGFMSVNEPAHEGRDSYSGSENERKYSMPNNSHAQTPSFARSVLTHSDLEAPQSKRMRPINEYQNDYQ